ncbi:hypothetical protein HUJ05_008199 [Dendroctonus ponderosae]|nr:hypothetical protein HUJ05_008199 [Dendroctonus ponderosae]
MNANGRQDTSFLVHRTALNIPEVSTPKITALIKLGGRWEIRTATLDKTAPAKVTVTTVRRRETQADFALKFHTKRKLVVIGELKTIKKPKLGPTAVTTNPLQPSGWTDLMTVS